MSAARRYNTGVPDPLPPLEQLREWLAVDESVPSGLVWIKPRRGRRNGYAGTCAGGRYWSINVRRRLIRAHRIVWALVTNEDPHPDFIDHIDRNGLNNAFGNLRRCSASQNNANSASRGGSSLYKGVYATSKRERRPWRSSVYGKKKYTLIGTHNTEREAAAAYNSYVARTRGEFAVFNVLDEPGRVLGAHELTTPDMWHMIGLTPPERHDEE